MDIIKNASKTIFQRLAWHTAERDQAGIAEELANEQEIHEVYGLGDAGLFDDFFCFLRELGIMKIIEQLANSVIANDKALFHLLQLFSFI